MKKISYGLIALFAAASSGCSGNKSSVCSGADVNEAFSAAGKADSLMYEIIRQETANPPFKADKKWIELNNAFEGIKKSLDEKALAIDAAKAKCVSMPNEFGKPNVGVSLLTMGEYFAASITRNALAEMGPDERRKIYTNVCNGDFSDFSEGSELNHYKFAEYTLPNRYRYWFYNVKKLTEDLARIESDLAQSEQRIQDYEANFFENAYKKVVFSIKDAALDASNESETSYSCSANLYAEIPGWNPSFRTVNYEVKITSDDNRRIQIKKDEAYSLMVFAKENKDDFIYD
jgi:hypothetical protein